MGEAHTKQHSQQECVQERVAYVRLALILPPVVNHAEDRDRIHEPMELDPVAAEPPLKAVRRGHR